MNQSLQESQPSQDRQRRFVSFRLEEDAFALPLERVERALRMVAPVQLPQAPSWVLGVINMHGQVLPVLDLGQRFGRDAKKPRPEPRLLVMSQQPRNVALLVDQVERVLSAHEGRLEPPSGHLAGSQVLAGVLKNNEELVLVLDPDRLAPLDWEKHEEIFKAMEQEAALREQLEQQQ
eukprot:TRINITY_DN7969_c0_g1_i1.p2 TRINITY_DN7969_c0_g1~~TRINITY_DN7969_c0_g1_i1.p2  ORF type:complete len:177 (-),score=53.30 TRINITY_DN7969_c0_g1_i1:69-599(-)